MNNTFKIINDPIYGLIQISDKTILKLIDHPYFQRLRRIKQMGLAEYVYPGAVHSRFQHSIGATHLMSTALSILHRKGAQTSKDDRLSAQYAILLHDIGHGPFSHALEYSIIQDVHHEDLSRMIMEHLNEELKGKLTNAISIFNDQHPRKFLHQLLSGQLDMDRMDYLNRDSFFSGVSEGIIGYDRILQMLDVKDDKLVLEEKGIHSMEKFIIARRLMYGQVYLHKTVISTEQLLNNILRRAKFLASQNIELLATPDFRFFLYENIDTKTLNEPSILKKYVNIDDSDIISSIKTWCNHKDKILANLCKSLINRHLYKVKLDKCEMESTLNEWKKKNNHFSDEEKDYYFVAGTADINTYSKTGTVKIAFKDNTLKDISEVDNALINPSIGTSVKKYFIGYLPSQVSI